MNNYESLFQEIKQMFGSASDALKLNELNETELTWEDFTVELCKKHQAKLVSSTSGCRHYEINIPFEKDYALLLKEKKGKAIVPLYFVFSQYDIKFTLAKIKLYQKNITVISLFLKKFSKMKNTTSFDLTVEDILENEISLREKKSEEDQEAYEQWLRKAMPEYYGKKEICDGVESKSNEQLMFYYIKQYIDEKINERISEILTQSAAGLLKARNSPISDDGW